MADRSRLRHPRVRVYETLRTAHLERAHEYAPASIVYLRRKYDFDPSLLAGLDVHQCSGPVELARLLLASRVRELEINEPLMLSALKLGLTAVGAARVAGWARGHRVTVVSYALANADPFAGPTARLRSPARRQVYRLATRILVRQLDRLAFGSAAAEAEYSGLEGRRPTTALVPALPAACGVCDRRKITEARRRTVLFLGAFDDRKGLVPLLDAWPLVSERMPGTRLEILGKGPLLALAEQTARIRDDVSLEVDPSRDRIHQALREARVLVLLSQPSATWREQIGLPIVEALAHGCEIVTTTETGLASWLRERQHEVLSPTSTTGTVADAVVRAVKRDRLPEDLLADLPERDGRRAADDWLFPQGRIR